jgi:hypothetical protein
MKHNIFVISQRRRNRRQKRSAPTISCTTKHLTRISPRQQRTDRPVDRRYECGRERYDGCVEARRRREQQVAGRCRVAAEHDDAVGERQHVVRIDVGRQAERAPLRAIADSVDRRHEQLGNVAVGALLQHDERRRVAVMIDHVHDVVLVRRQRAHVGARQIRPCRREEQLARRQRDARQHDVRARRHAADVEIERQIGVVHQLRRNARAERSHHTTVGRSKTRRQLMGRYREKHSAGGDHTYMRPP